MQRDRGSEGRSGRSSERGIAGTESETILTLGTLR